ncbi:MAG TPA: hypothetical protein VLS89_03535, partial [Candidatus Nanopelagicales bacterium]|nr:hypothetical protein [Candidatus Nanopelagicales bacterium]
MHRKPSLTSGDRFARLLHCGLSRSFLPLLGAALLSACASSDPEPEAIDAPAAIALAPGPSPEGIDPADLPRPLELPVGEEIDLGPPVLGPTAGSKGRPALAASEDQYLVAWSETVPGAPYEHWLRAIRVGLDGAPLEEQAVLLGRGVRPAVASNGEGFLVVYNGGEECTLCAVRFDAQGARLDASPISLEEPNPLATAGRAAKVAFQGSTYQVVWPCGSTDLCAARVTPDGEVLTPYQGVNIVAHSVHIASNGSGSLMVARTGDQILGFRLDAQGALLDASPSWIGEGWPGSTDSLDAVAFDGANYVVAWSHIDYNQNTKAVYAARVTPAGVVLDPGGIALRAPGPGP